MTNDPDLNRGLRFRTGDVFPSDDALARWATVLSMALNDMVLVQAKLVQPAFNESWPTYERQYFIRLAASHLYEFATFLGSSRRRYPEIRRFVEGLDAEFRERHEALVAIGQYGSGDLRDQLARARNHFAHYQELLDRSAVEHEDLKQAMDAAEEGEIRLSQTMRKFRATFADTVVTYLTMPKGTTYAEGEEIPAEIIAFVRMFGEQTASVITFANFALQAYTRTLPPGSYETFEE
jgi:hypothetical protein